MNLKFIFKLSSTLILFILFSFLNQNRVFANNQCTGSNFNMIATKSAFLGRIDKIQPPRMKMIPEKSQLWNDLNRFSMLFDFCLNKKPLNFDPSIILNPIIKGLQSKVKIDNSFSVLIDKFNSIISQQMMRENLKKFNGINSTYGGCHDFGPVH